MLEQRQVLAHGRLALIQRQVIGAVHRRLQVLDGFLQVRVVSERIGGAHYIEAFFNEGADVLTLEIGDQALLDRISREAKARLLATTPVGSHSSHFQSLLSDDSFQIFYHAPSLVLISGNAPDQWVVEDCALAAQNLILPNEIRRATSSAYRLLRPFEQGHPWADKARKKLDAIAAARRTYQRRKGSLDAIAVLGRLAEVVASHARGRPVLGVLLDLGVSSPQLDDPERGFSFLNDGPLDMRMDPSRGISAAEFVNTAPVEEIARVFKEYGEERFSGRMARAVVERRDIKPFERTGDLAEVLKVANPAWEKGKNPATRAFQGLRIHVNNELGDLEAGLDAALEALEIGGRLVVISFHSLEDRIVKLFMRKLVKGESDNLPRNLPVRFEAFSPKIKVHGKAQFAGEAELKANPRSRSAVMRVAEKLR